MPQYFQLINKATGEAEKFTDIDAAMCAHFGAPCHETEWYQHWYPLLMEWGVAFGKSFAQLRDMHSKPYKGEEEAAAQGRAHERDGRLRLLEIIDWLDARYAPDAWATVGR